MNDDNAEFEIESYIANWKRTGAYSEFKRYFKYFSVAGKLFRKRKKYNIIVGWQQFYALIFCFYCSLFHVKKRNKVIALNFTYKEKGGFAGKIYFKFMKRCVNEKYLDGLCVLSQSYAKIVSETFDYPIEKIMVQTFGINDPYEAFSKMKKPNDAPKEGYALSIGRSNRDFDFLISAWKNIDYPLVIISDTYSGNNGGNDNVKIITNVAGKESYPWIANSSLAIIPIDDGTICSGDTVLLTSLAMKKKMLITEPSTLSEMYIVSGENGISSPKEEAVFADYVKDLIFSDKYDFLSENARTCFLEKYSREGMGRKVRKFIIE
jgi:hypothetical protein